MDVQNEPYKIEREGGGEWACTLCKEVVSLCLLFFVNNLWTKQCTNNAPPSAYIVYFSISLSVH